MIDMNVNDGMMSYNMKSVFTQGGGKSIILNTPCLHDRKAARDQGEGDIRKVSLWSRAVSVELLLYQ